MRRGKVFFAGIVLGIVLTVAVQVYGEYISVALDDISIYVNGVRVRGSNLIYNDKTYVPLREIAEMLNKDVFWDEKLKAATITDKVPPAEYSTKGYSFSSVSIKTDAFYTRVQGEIENKTSRNKTQIVFTVNFYDSGNRLLGTANAVVDNIARGEKRSFTAYGDPVGKFTKYTIQIDTEV